MSNGGNSGSGGGEFKPTKGWLGQKQIWRNGSGDPDFTNMEQLKAVFTEAEIVYLVNKAVYFLEYQREHHKKRAAEEREALAPVKRKLKELFGVSWLKATEEQQREAVEAVRKEING